MLQKSTFRKIFRLNHFFILPLIGGMIAFSSCKDDKKDKTEQSEQEIAPAVNIKGLTPIKDASGTSFSNIDKVPVYPGCEGSKEELENCMVTKISDFVRKNFDTTLGGKLNATGKQSISVDFRIDKGGNITDVRAKADHREFEDEAVRVFQNLPSMTPAEHNGEKSGVPYSMEVVLEMK